MAGQVGNFKQQWKQNKCITICQVVLQTKGTTLCICSVMYFLLQPDQQSYICH